MRHSVTLATAALITSLASVYEASPSDSQVAQRSVPESGAMTIVALGDSLTSGHRLSAAEAYPALLEQELAREALPFRMVNQGVSGDTSEGGLRRLDAALRERPRILIVELGINDGLRGVPIS